MKRFYVGLHQLSMPQHFDHAFISANLLWKRKSDFIANKWIMDSGAFTEISTHGEYRHSVKEHARLIKRWASVGNLQAAVAQDWMCEPFIVKKTGLSVAKHQDLTIDRYDELLDRAPPVYIMPVLQGFRVYDYLKHLDAYGDRIAAGSLVGVGSVCKRNANVNSIWSIFSAIKNARPDLRLHGFGLKITALRNPTVRYFLYSADSMAWSFAARLAGRDQNSWKEAKLFEGQVREVMMKPERKAFPIWLKGGRWIGESERYKN